MRAAKRVMTTPRASKSFETSVADCLQRERLLLHVHRIGIAVSGGADSVALLRVMLPLCRNAGVAPVVLHLDHALRGRASQADARFVVSLARKLGVPCRSGIASRDDFLRASGSIEMKARAARQRFFAQMIREERLDAIATGHTADDVSETLFLRLLRGSGASGLSGLRPSCRVAGVSYVRPLLMCSHEDAKSWLVRHGWRWREDSSNGDLSIPRNHVRHVILPWMEKHGMPSIRSMLTQSAAILRDEDAFLDEWTERVWRTLAHQDKKTAKEYATLDRMQIATLPVAVQRRVLRKWFLVSEVPDSGGWNEVESILARLQQADPWQIMLPGRLLVRHVNGKLELQPPTQEHVIENTPAVVLPVPGTIQYRGVHVSARRSRGIVATQSPIGSIPSSCALDADVLQGKTLAVRTRKSGDRLFPIGLRGSKRLQDVFVDAKVPSERRDEIPVLVCGEDVVWIPGFRVHRDYAVHAPRASSIRIEMTPIPEPVFTRRHTCRNPRKRLLRIGKTRTQPS